MTGRALGALLALAGAVLVAITGDFSALWFMAVGWFLYEAASTSAVQEQFLERIDGLTVGDVMRRTEMAIDGDSTVAAALELHGWGDKLRAMPVDVDGRVTGIFGTREVTKVDAEKRSSVLVRDAMTPIGPADVVATDAGLRRALTPAEGSSGVLVIVDRGEVVGLLTAEELSAVFADLRRDR